MAAAKKKSNRSKTTNDSSSRQGAGKQAKETQAPPRRREIGAFVCLLFGIFGFLAYFPTTAWLLHGLRVGISGLLGWGFYAVPPLLFIMAAILAFHRGRPVILRVTSAACIPLLIGSGVHLLFSNALLPSGADIVQGLWISGQMMTTGGVLGGLLATGLERMVSTVGAMILLLLGLAFTGLVVCNRTISDLADWLRNRESIPYEPEPEPEPLPKFAPEPRFPRNEKRIGPPVIDIPIDEEEPIESRRRGMGIKASAKNPIQLKKPGAVSPDRILEDEGAGTPAPVGPLRSAFSRAFDIPVQEGSREELPGALSSDVSDLRPYQTAKSAIREQEIRSDRDPVPGKLKAKEVEAARADIARDIEKGMSQPLPDYSFPSTSLLKLGKQKGAVESKEEVTLNAERLAAALVSFGIDASIVSITRGPSVTRYEVELEAGIKLNKLTNLADDLALSLGASGVRIAPIPGKISTVGIEVPNKLVSTVHLREVVESKNFTSSRAKLSFALGKDISGTCMVGDISKLPHLLIAGTTGSGKSVTMNSIILSVLYKARPDEVKFIMIDPKMVEFGIYNGIPHLLIPVVTDPKKAAGALQWAVTEMLKRYKCFSETGARDLAAYNKQALGQEDLTPFPQLVVVIDELADLMLVASKEVEESICRVAQMGRAAGIHLVIATQRPSADVITGLMKANIPSRIALAVSSAMESRIILDTMGAEKLVGNGDMLFKPVGANKPTRIQGTFVSDQEREQVIDFLKASGVPEYDAAVGNFIEKAASDEKAAPDPPQESGSDYDEMFGDAVNVLLDLGQASVSVLQRKLKLGYSRAARLMDQLEEAGVVGPFEGSKPRQVLLSRAQWQAMQAGGMPDATKSAYDDIPKDDFSDLKPEGEESDEETGA